MYLKKNTLLILALITLSWFNAHAFSVYPTTSDFKVKGFHLDLRIQVMTIPALKSFAKQLSEHGINTLVMEWEGTYPFEKHPLLSNRFAYTREEVSDFVSYCNHLHIDVIPLQQSFGHVEYILRHPRYKELREDQKDYSQVNPLKEDLNRELFTDLYQDLISTHTSAYIHIGGDETYLLGHSTESKKKVAEFGKGRLYGDYIKLLCDIVVSLGKRPVLWADIAMKYPDALEGLPKETIFVDWNYGWDVNMFGKHSNLLQSGFEIWGAPSIRSHPDNYFLTQWEKHFHNIRDFIPQARKFGYNGIIMTSWSTSGLYSAVWESTRDIIDLYPIRRVYPITGFNMLINAFFESINQHEPLDTEKFVFQYAKNMYGFNKQEAKDFWTALKSAPYEVVQGRIHNSAIPMSVLLDSAEMASTLLHQLKPKHHVEEFEHYRLMADIRLQYLKTMDIEMRINSPNFKREHIGNVLDELEEIRLNDLDQRFYDLNKYSFFSSELKQENEYRNSKLQKLIQRLSNNKTD